MNAYRANLPLFATDERLELPTFDRPGGSTTCPGCGRALRSFYVGSFFGGPHRIGTFGRCRIRGPHLHQRCTNDSSSAGGCGAEWTTPAMEMA